MNKFDYSEKSIACYYNGCWLDSLLELRYILSIEHTHSWLRDGLSIYYNINVVPEGMEGGLEKYTPDFLIRNNYNRKALLIEVKPDQYDDKQDLNRRKKIAEEYIELMGYDWEFKIVFARDIILSQNAETKYNEILNHLKSGAKEINHSDGVQQNWSYKKFVEVGVLPAEEPQWDRLLRRLYVCLLITNV
jgi:hypothetical protein